MPDPTSSKIVSEVLTGRRTINSFDQTPVPEEILVAAVNAARWAPNHKLTEPWRFHLLGTETAKSLVELNARIIEEKKGPKSGDEKRRKWSEVPGWLVVTCVRSDDTFREEEDYAACCCAIQNLTLSLWANGVGAKWSTGEVTRHADFFELLKIDPAEQRVVGLISFGYPRAVPIQSRKPVESILHRLP